MIEKEVLKVSKRGFNVEIFSPQGAEIGKKTFNKNIGVEGGISIIGTKGIVYPMSEDAIKKTIYLEIDGILQNSEKKEILLVPGNYGEGLKEKLNTIIDLPTVKISNYIGDSLSYAYSKGFKTMTLLEHIGKFAKLSIYEKNQRRPRKSAIPHRRNFREPARRGLEHGHACRFRPLG